MSIDDIDFDNSNVVSDPDKFREHIIKDIESYKCDYQGTDEEFDSAAAIIKQILFESDQIEVINIQEKRPHIAQLAEKLMNSKISGKDLEQFPTRYDVSYKGKLKTTLTNLNFVCEEKGGKITVKDRQ